MTLNTTPPHSAPDKIEAEAAADEPSPRLAKVPAIREPERLRAMLEVLFDQNPDGVAYADAKGNVTINRAGQAILGPTAQVQDGGMDQWQQAFGVFLPDGKTPHPTETMPLARALLKGETIIDYPLIIKTPTFPQGRWITGNTTPMANGEAISIFRDITERKQLEAELAQRNQELARQLAENNSLIERLRLAVDELSTPVLELADDILALPVVGIVDTVRSARMMEKILAEVVARRSRAVIIDVTGVDVIDTSTADRLIRIARSIELLGAECVISGVQPAVSQTLTELGVSFRGLTMQRNLKRALDVCVTRLQNNRRSSAH